MTNAGTGNGYYLWAFDVTPEETHQLLARLPGVGAVLDITNYEASRQPGRWIARVQNRYQAERLVSTGGQIELAIIQDERNLRPPSWRDWNLPLEQFQEKYPKQDRPGGLSGKYLHPEEYRQLWEETRQPLDAAGIPVCTMGLAFLGEGFWQNVRHRRKYDTAYHQLLPSSDYRAMNPGRTTTAEVHRAIALQPEAQWLLSPHPYTLTCEVAHPWFMDRFVRHLHLPFYDALIRTRGVRVAVWSLRQHVQEEGKPGERLQDFHSVYNPENRLTQFGREFRRHLLERYGLA